MPQIGLNVLSEEASKGGMERWMKLQKKALPILWLASLILFPFEPAGRDIVGSCWACPNTADETAPTPPHANCMPSQNMHNAFRRVDNDVMPAGVQRHPSLLHPVAILVLSAKPRLDDRAHLLSRRWQFALRAAVSPRAPSSPRTSC